MDDVIEPRYDVFEPLARFFAGWSPAMSWATIGFAFLFYFYIYPWLSSWYSRRKVAALTEVGKAVIFLFFPFSSDLSQKKRADLQEELRVARLKQSDAMRGEATKRIQPNLS